MGRDSTIAWCHHTFNLWWGCFKYSDGCKFCYAEVFDRRVHGRDSDHWMRDGSRRWMTEKYWQQPLLWNKKAAAAGVRERVFCGSMHDWAEQHPEPSIQRVMDSYRGRAFELVKDTPNLDWLFLSKRTDQIEQYLPWGKYDKPWSNVWILTTVENQAEADRRIPQLLRINAAIRGLSCEPLLGPISLGWLTPRLLPHDRTGFATAAIFGAEYVRTIDWVIAGVESGPHARYCDIDSLRSLRDQCKEAGTKFLLKQAPETTHDGDLHVIRRGPGSFAKGKVHGMPLIELPYLDGVQHAEFPEVNHAA